MQKRVELDKLASNEIRRTFVYKSRLRSSRLWALLASPYFGAPDGGSLGQRINTDGVDEVFDRVQFGARQDLSKATRRAYNSSDSAARWTEQRRLPSSRANLARTGSCANRFVSAYQPDQRKTVRGYATMTFFSE